MYSSKRVKGVGLVMGLGLWIWDDLGLGLIGFRSLGSRIRGLG